MDKQFASFIPSNFPGSTGGRPLRGMHHSSTLAASSPNSPPAVMRNNVLIAFRHIGLLILLLAPPVSETYINQARLFQFTFASYFSKS